MTHLSKLIALYESEKGKLLEDYFTFLRFPSISADPKQSDQTHLCAKWVESYLKEGGFSTNVWETSGYPVVYAEWLKAGPDKPTLLFYGHYDVQPVDPLDEWESPPFEPTLRGREVYARGAEDNKGQAIYTMGAITALLKREGSLPVNIKFCIEGEEEVKSHGLGSIIPSKRKELAADYLIIPDFDIPSLEKPAVTLGLRGVLALTLELQGTSSDLHSGVHGGVVYNPNHALVEMLAALRDEEGRVRVPGFYDDVEELSDKEKKTLHLEADDSLYPTSAMTGGEKKYPAGERVRLRPTLEINGVSGGYAGPGFKTVIPARASAKISCRLVPRQDPQKIRDCLVAYLEKLCPKGITMKLIDHGGERAARTSPTTRIAEALKAAYEEVLEAPCSFTMSGGSVPISASLTEVSQAETVFMGFGLAEDNIHAPNEHFGIDRLELGFLVIGRLIQRLGETK